MGATYESVGRAVAVAKGHYPTGDGRHATIMPGQEFTVFKGLDTGKWFKLLPAGAQAPVPAPAAPEPTEPNTLQAVAKAERKRKAEVKPPTAEDLV